MCGSVPKAPRPVAAVSIYSTWDLEKAKDTKPRFDEPLSAEMNWERVTYFLGRVVPVADECKVRMACHPCDPVAAPGLSRSRPGAGRSAGL